MGDEIIQGVAVSIEETIVGESTEKKSRPDKKDNIVDVLKIVSPGTSLRTALDDLLRAHMGALVVVDGEGLSSITEGGFKINTKFSSQKLVELAKMDGAIILSRDLKRILYANTLLVPNISGISTKETGTRHKAAERSAKQTKAISIAVSERKNKISVYFGEDSYVLQESSEILRRASETLQILEKQREIYEDLIGHLNILEITGFVTTSDVSEVLQRIAMIQRISEMVKRYLIELGKEGLVVSMRLKELTKNLSREREMILRDYFGKKFLRADTILQNMNFDFLIENSNICRLLFDDLHDTSISSRGLRILSKTNLLDKDIKLLRENFGSLDKIFNANLEKLIEVFKNEDVAKSFYKKLEKIRDKIISKKKI